MSVLQIFMFGGLRILMDNEILPSFPTRKTRSLFAYLVTYRQRQHARHTLAGIFWGDMPEERAQRNLSTTLWRLRQVLPSRYLRADDTTIAFNTEEPYWLDTEQFEEELAQAKGEDAAAMAHLQTAMHLYRGDFLHGLYDDWLLVETERLRLSFQQALLRLFNYYKTHHFLDQALETGQQLLALDPLREDVHLGMMEIYQQLGQRSAALTQYQRCRQILQKELAVEPLPETRALYEQLLVASKAPGVFLPTLLKSAEPPRLPRTSFDDFGQAPWVGREEELALIEQRLERLQNGAGGILLVGGEAGVGKTRLAERATDLARAQGMTTLWGVCPDLQEPPPYQGLSEILQKGLEELDIDAMATAPSWLGELAFLLPGLHRHPYRFRHPSPDPDDAYSRSRLLPAIWQLLNTIADHTPCLLVLDDLHWADAATLEALRYLLPHLRSAPILFLLTFRPEELPGHPTVAQTILALEANILSTRLDLAPLSAAETDQLLQRALGWPIPHPILGQLVYSETEGNPFFIGEVLKALVEEKLLYLDEEQGWRTPWDQDAEDTNLALPPSLPLPRGIRRLVEHRLARLSQPARTVLAQLAVLGREIDYDVLFHVCPVEEEELLAATDALLHRHLLVETKEGVRFSHDKIRQTVYENISRPRRRQLHRRAGETLASITPDRVEELAHHFHQAQDYVRTLDYALAAGARARRLYANQAALAYYDWAIQAASHLDNEHGRQSLILAHEQRGRIYRQLSEMNAAVQEYRAMQAAAEVAGNGVAQARAVRLAGWIQGNLQGNWDLGLEEAQRARRLAQQAHDPREEAAALRDIGVYHNLRGEYPQALAALHGALDRFRQLQDGRGEAGTLQYLAVTFHFLNRYDDATRAYEQALALWQLLEDRLAEIKVLANMGYLLISDGRLTAATAAFVRAEAILQEIEATAVKVWVRMGVAAVARYQGRYQECVRILTAITTEWQELIDTDYLRALVAEHQGMSLWQMGELNPALLSLQNALELARASNTPSLLVGILTDLGRCWRQLGDVAEAQRLHRAALALLAKEPTSAMAITLASDLGLDAVLLGKHDEGRALLQDAVAATVDLPRWNRAQVLLNQAEALLALAEEDAVFAAQEALNGAQALEVTVLQVHAQLLLARALARQGRWPEAESALQKGLDLLATEGVSLARGRLLHVLARVQLAAGQKRSSALTWKQACDTRALIGATLPELSQRRQWLAHLTKVETHIGGALTNDRICILLPRRGAPAERVAVVWTVDAGLADETVAREQGKVALRRRRLCRLQAEAGQQGALALETELAAALGVSVRTVKRDMAVLRQQNE